MTRFAEGLIGNPAVARLLESALEHPAPAYLLHGPSHAGKRTFAERFVRQLLGLELEDAHWRIHPDFVLLEPEEGKKQVSVEQVRDAREKLSLRPSLAPRVVMYVPHADRLNESGTNALLKAVEEPPAGAVFVFVAEDVSKIPATLCSRCVMLPFTAMSTVNRTESLTDTTGRQFAEQFLTSKSAGARLAAVEDLTKSCEAEEDVETAWREALQSAMKYVGSSLNTDSIRATVVGIALIAASQSIGSPVSPRFALDACAARLDDELLRAPSVLFPTHVPRGMHPLYTVS